MLVPRKKAQTKSWRARRLHRLAPRERRPT